MRTTTIINKQRVSSNEKKITIGRIKRSYFGGFLVKPSPTNVTLVTIRFHAFPKIRIIKCIFKFGLYLKCCFSENNRLSVTAIIFTV